MTLRHTYWDMEGAERGVPGPHVPCIHPALPRCAWALQLVRGGGRRKSWWLLVCHTNKHQEH